MYDGSNTVPTAVTTIPTDGTDYLYYKYQGFVDTKTASNVTVASGTTPSTTAPSVGTVGSYDLTIDDASKFTLENYSALANKGTFTITQKEVTIAATSDLSHAYGSAENFAFTLTSGTYVAADENAIKYVTKVVKGDTADDEGQYTLTPAFMTESEIESKVDADDAIDAANKATSKATYKAVLKNYKLKPTAGYLKYANAALQIALNESKYTLTKVYDGQDATITTPASEDDLLIIGKQKDTDVIDLSGLTVTLTPKTATNTTKSNVDTYTISLSGATAENYDITYIPSQYTITKRNLKVTVYDQTFVNGEVQALNTTLYSIEEKEGEGLASTDTADKVFKLTTTVTFDAGGKVNSSAGDYQINVADAGVTGSKYANYTITVANADGTTTYGKATVVSTAIVLDDSKSLVDAAAKSADATGATITFSSRNLNAEKWNVLVLPFDIAVKDLAAAFDYAVIDVLDQTVSDGNMHFKFAVTGDIKANTPFLLYPTSTYNNLNQVTFSGVTIKKGAMSKATVEVKDGSNNKLVGTWKSRASLTPEGKATMTP